MSASVSSDPPSVHLEGTDKIHRLLRLQEYLQADTELGMRLERTPGDAELHYLQGVSHYLQNRAGPAQTYLEQAVRLDSSHLDALICLSILLNDQGMYAAAEKLFQKAQQTTQRPPAGRPLSENHRLNRRFARRHLETATLYEQHQRLTEAREEMARAAALSQPNPEIELRLALLTARQGFTGRAIQELVQLKREYPDFIPARLQLGLILFTQEKIIEAEAEWEEARRLHPEHPDADTFLRMSQYLQNGRAGGSLSKAPGAELSP